MGPWRSPGTGDLDRLDGLDLLDRLDGLDGLTEWLVGLALVADGGVGVSCAAVKIC